MFSIFPYSVGEQSATKCAVKGSLRRDFLLSQRLSFLPEETFYNPALSLLSCISYNKWSVLYNHFQQVMQRSASESHGMKKGRQLAGTVALHTIPQGRNEPLLTYLQEPNSGQHGNGTCVQTARATWTRNSYGGWYTVHVLLFSSASF